MGLLLTQPTTLSLGIPFESATHQEALQIIAEDKDAFHTRLDDGISPKSRGLDPRFVVTDETEIQYVCAHISNFTIHFLASFSLIISDLGEVAMSRERCCLEISKNIQVF